MRKIFLLLTASLLFISYSEAQVSLGAKGGLNLSWLSTDIEDASQQPAAGIHGGLSAQFGLPFLHPRLAFQPDVLYSLQGAVFTFEDNGYDGYAFYDVEGRVVTRTRFLNVMAPLKFTGGMENFGYYFLAGPYVGYWMSGRVDAEVAGTYSFFPFNMNRNSDYEFSDEDRRIDLGITIGAGIRVAFGPGDFLLETRYNHGFVNNIGTSIEPVGEYFSGVDFRENSANRFISITVGYLVHLSN